jgi:hypothetical protein
MAHRARVITDPRCSGMTRLRRGQKRYDELQAAVRFDHLYHRRARWRSVRDLGREAPPTHVPRSAITKDLPGRRAGLSASSAPAKIVPPRLLASTAGTALAMAGPFANPLRRESWSTACGTITSATSCPRWRHRSHGPASSHPELLDWLADEFVRGGWRMSRSTASGHVRRLPANLLHRDEAHRLDPMNRLLWRFRHSASKPRRSRPRVSAASRGGSRSTPASGNARARRWLAARKTRRPGHRRSLYCWRRTGSYLMSAFAYRRTTSCARRANTITAPYTLSLLNGQESPKRRAFATRGGSRARTRKTGRRRWFEARIESYELAYRMSQRPGQWISGVLRV